LDVGLLRTTTGNRVFGALKVCDAVMEIVCVYVVTYVSSLWHGSLGASPQVLITMLSFRHLSIPLCRVQFVLLYYM
jgi:hypothetical protein